MEVEREHSEANLRISGKVSVVNAVDGIRAALAASRKVIFDFDGTLVDSNEIKRHAFDLVFADYPDHMKEIQEYCHGNNHTIRGEKFRYVSEKILGLPYTAERDRSLHELYEGFTTESVATAPEIPGALAFLRSLKSHPPALVSATPHDILLKILDRRGWRSMFDEVRGAPVNKAAWLRTLQANLECRSAELVFIGDSDEDEKAARASGCTFVRVGKISTNGELAIQDFTCL
jgi:phosphoglycolate phosphatase-like HAD superfamily hydrolase